MTTFSLAVTTTLMFVVLFVWVALAVVAINYAAKLFYWLEKREKVKEGLK